MKQAFNGLASEFAQGSLTQTGSFPGRVRTESPYFCQGIGEAARVCKLRNPDSLWQGSGPIVVRAGESFQKNSQVEEDTLAISIDMHAINKLHYQLRKEEEKTDFDRFIAKAIPALNNMI